MTRGDASDRAVYVEAPARLHFGMFDLRGSLGRRFGGIGAGIPEPSLLLEARPHDDLTADGPDASRALAAARSFAAFHGVHVRAHLRVHRALPRHAGLGSGTQLALSVARALAELYNLPSGTDALVRAVGRARRSAVGTWSFALGGLIVEGGRREDSPEPAPLLARLELPTTWRYVVAIPRAVPGLHGEAEMRAFARLEPPPVHDAERVAHLVLMQLLPAVAERDLASFGAALTEIQRLNGRWFAAAQGGVYVPGPSAELVEAMDGWGAAGVGQSSWGPAVYGVVEGNANAGALGARVHAAFPETSVYFGGFARAGASCVSRPSAHSAAPSPV